MDETEQEKLQERHRQYIMLLVGLNDMQEQVLKLHNQILEDDSIIVEKLDRNPSQQ